MGRNASEMEILESGASCRVERSSLYRVIGTLVGLYSVGLHVGLLKECAISNSIHVDALVTSLRKLHDMNLQEENNHNLT